MSSLQLALLNEKEKFEALFQFASVGILIVDKTGSIVLANNYLLQQFGYADAAGLAGKKIEVLIPARFHGRHVQQRESYTSQPQNRPMGMGMDLFGIKKSGEEFPVEVSLSNYRNEETNFVIAFVNDITRRKQIEADVLRQQNELAAINEKIETLNDELEDKVQLRTRQLEQAMTALEHSKDELAQALSKEKELSDLKSRFVSMASHEFRTPLSTILSSASLLAKYTNTEEQDKRDKHILRIKSAVHNLTDILNEFLSIGKIEDGKITASFSNFDIKTLVQTVVAEMQGISRAGQQIQYIHTGNTTVSLDITLLRNIIINLLSNAIKFSPENSTINVQTTVTGSQVIMMVEDSGMGISNEDQEHLFERFFRGKNATNIQGTGLGLHIVGRYAALMQGSITCKSELEKGTIFTLTFNHNYATA
ncbi:MAG TPA: PAS domain-containing sensor histidine kinase [Ferruginibacter sp.]|nr:PAS domain-containing sensor histidine kinase [Ferruginibacter sp.]HMP21201.1 PAS domain-containing sensor histidine kinase [Ferruginibacter sp.]